MNKHLYSVRKMSKLLNISRATKHKYNNYELPESKKLKCKVINLMVQIWEDSKRRYGAPKIRYLLEKNHDILVATRTVSVYMNEIEIQSQRVKKYRLGKSQKDNKNEEIYYINRL